MSENSIQANTDEPIIICRDVHKWFGNFHALKGINMDVQKKEVIVIFGPSGSGKSTFIRTLNRLEEHQQGHIPARCRANGKGAPRIRSRRHPGRAQHGSAGAQSR